MTILIFILGTFMGSFFLCISEDKGLFRRSRCDHCFHTLGIFDLIPIFSFLLLKGRCRYCGEKLSIRYPLSEILCGILYILVWLSFGYSLKCAEYLILTSILLLLSFCDLKTYTVPDICILAGILNRLVFAFLCQEEILPFLRNGALMALFLFLPSFLLSRICKREMLGGGDVLLVFVLSMYTDLYGGVTALMIASLSGLAVILLSGRRMIPFVPCIFLGYLMVFLLLG